MMFKRHQETFSVTFLQSSELTEHINGNWGDYSLIDMTKKLLCTAKSYTLTMDDWDMIRQCPYFWARKFDMNKDSNIIDKVFETWH